MLRHRCTVPLYCQSDKYWKATIFDYRYCQQTLHYYVSAISHKLGDDWCNCLPRFHAFSSKYYINLLKMLRTPPILSIF